MKMGSGLLGAFLYWVLGVGSDDEVGIFALLLAYGGVEGDGR